MSGETSARRSSSFMARVETIRTLMRGFLLTTIGLWVLALPVLCLAGVTAHPCGDCGVSLCSHEEDCAEDPCPGTYISSSAFRGDPSGPSASAAFAHSGFLPHPELWPGFLSEFPPNASAPNLHVHSSDLPLLL